MGNHRASIKIEMEFHEVKDNCDMWINFNGHGEVDGVDDRIIEFVRNVYERGMDKYYEEEEKWEEEEQKDEVERKEKLELERLKKKYET